MKGNTRENSTTKPFLNFLELETQKFDFFTFGASTYGHATVLFLNILKVFLYYFKD